MTPLERHIYRHSKRISAKGEIVLDIINQGKDKVNVMQVLRAVISHRLATQATAHSELMKLQTNGYINITPSEADKRIKDCSLTLKGKRYLEQL